jgi:hypothetical protein
LTESEDIDAPSFVSKNDYESYYTWIGKKVKKRQLLFMGGSPAIKKEE